MSTKDKDQYSFPSVWNRLSGRKYSRGKAMDDIALLFDVVSVFFPTSTSDTAKTTNTKGSTAGAAVTAAVGAAAVAGAVTGSAAAGGAISIASFIITIIQKGKLISAAKRVIEALSKNYPKYDGKYACMQDAYTALWIAAFFDAFEKTVPKDIKEQIKLRASEKEYLATPCPNLSIENSNLESTVVFPDLVFGMNRVYERLEVIYKGMANRLGAFISQLAFFEQTDESKKEELQSAISEIPNNALKIFSDQYIVLYTHFPEFAAYIDLEKEKESSRKSKAQHNALVELIRQSKNEAKAEMTKGFQDLEDALHNLYNIQRENEAKEITDQIINTYKRAVTQPIVETEVTEEADELNYPPIEGAFIPQRYQLLEYEKDMHLELESQWEKIDPREDMQAFWARYILDEQSTSHLVLILGDPGGGKSLLTKMVSAKISSNAELVIRIPLRRYSSRLNEMEIEKIVCEQIGKDGDAADEIKSLKQIVGSDPEHPTTLIFDGYDEVQQATGMPYSSFLVKLHEYQELCKNNNRPVRIVVTSRRTLIDKANIPVNTIVMKLLAFDPKQKDQWIRIWNDNNRDLLKKADIQEFSLPLNNKEIDELSSQPLLLLMLAIYDADFENGKNALQAVVKSKTESFNQTRLYDELIRRFIRRELKKSDNQKESRFIDLPSDEQKRMVDAEIEKLGIAALGMFVRRRLWITVAELKADFGKLGIKQKGPDKENMLEDEEIFLGSFFFIHDARSEEKTDPKVTVRNKKHEDEASFVFLHKTFYEFLVADYVLSDVFEQTIELAQIKGMSRYERDIASFSTMLPRFYMSINGAPLCAEPEITAMISEWGLQKIDRLVNKVGVSVEDLLDVIGDMITKYTEHISKNEIDLPYEQSILQGQPETECHALFILNLVTVRILLSGSWETELELWQFLAQYIKVYAHINRDETDAGKNIAALSATNLYAYEEIPLRFMAIFQIEESREGFVTIKKRSGLMDLTNQDPIDARAEVYRFQQDRVSEAFYLYHSAKKPYKEKLGKIKELTFFDDSLRLESEIAQLKYMLNQGETLDRIRLEYIMTVFCHRLVEARSDTSTILSWLVFLREIIGRTTFHEPLCRDNARVAEEITSVLFERYRKNRTREWENVFILWLDIYMNDLSELLEWTVINTIGIFFRHSQMVELSDNILYMIAKFCFAIKNSKAVFHERDFHYNNLELDRYTLWLHFVSSIMYRPKRAAGILLLMRCADPDDYELRKDITKYPIHIANSTVLEELPYLLWEYIAIDKKDIVQDVLSKITLEPELICSPSIREYIMIADEVRAKGFLHTVFNLALSYHSDDENCCAAVVHSACALLAHNSFTRANDLVKAMQEYVSCQRLLEADLEGTTRLLTLLHRYKNTVIKWRGVEDGIISAIEHIHTSYQHSPQTAVEFLQEYAQYYADNSQFNQSVRNLLVQAHRKGQMEDAEKLKKLLESKKR